MASLMRTLLILFSCLLLDMQKYFIYFLRRKKYNTAKNAPAKLAFLNFYAVFSPHFSL